MAILRPRPRTGIIPLPTTPPEDYVAWVERLRRAHEQAPPARASIRIDLGALLTQIEEQARGARAEGRRKVTPLFTLDSPWPAHRSRRLIEWLERLEVGDPGTPSRLIGLRWRVSLALRRHALGYRRRGRGRWGVVRIPEAEILESTRRA